LAMLLIADGLPESQVQPMNKGGMVTVPDGAGLTVSLTHAFHSNSYRSADGNTRYAGEACGLMIGLESRRTVYHAGDTALFGDMRMLGERFQPEVALLPIGDRFTMGPEDAAEAVRMLKPKTVVPVHYATFDMLTGTPEAFVQAVRKRETETKVVVLDPGEK